MFLQKNKNKQKIIKKKITIFNKSLRGKPTKYQKCLFTNQKKLPKGLNIKQEKKWQKLKFQ